MPSGDADLLDLSAQQLDVLLGEALYADDFGAKEPSESDKRRRGENWFAAQTAQLQQAVCGHAAVQRYVTNKDAIERELFDAVLSALASLVGMPVPVAVLAAKIVRYGVTNLCGCDAVPPPAAAASPALPAPSAGTPGSS